MTPPTSDRLPQRIFHVATESDWHAARRAGVYTTSTRGRTLAEEGFIHASRADQWQGVRERFFADVTEPLVLLVIERARLDVPVVEEGVPDSGETFPHVYGPIPTAAVVQALPLASDVAVAVAAGSTRTAGAASGGQSFSRLYLQELFVIAGLGLALVLLVLVGVGVGKAVGKDWAVWLGVLVALALGLPLVTRLYRRRG